MCVAVCLRSSLSPFGVPRRVAGRRWPLRCPLLGQPASALSRRRIERDLHDGIRQQLVSLMLELRTAQAAVSPELGELRAGLSRVAGGLTGVFDRVREISRGIHPAILSENGLRPALKALARRCAVPVELDLRAGRLPGQVEVAAYYAVSEALANAAKRLFHLVSAYIGSPQGELRPKTSAKLSTRWLESITCHTGPFGCPRFHLTYETRRGTCSQRPGPPPADRRAWTPADRQPNWSPAGTK